MSLDRRTFLKSTALLALVRPSLLLAEERDALSSASTSGAKLFFSSSNDVKLGGYFGTRYKQSLERLSKAPIDSIDFVLDDVNFNQKRRFYNYSGDISGRYLEVASLTSTKDAPTTPIITKVVDEIVQYQKEDGHFGREVDWEKPVDVAGSTDQSLEMPILWGNGRLMLGLFAAYERFGNAKALEAAKRMADFYVNIVVKRFCDPARMDEYNQQAKGYAAAYVTCVFHGIEGLVRAYRVTGEKKYLDCAVQMADFHEQFDTLPVGHSHGSISAHEALVMLYEETGQKKYLERVEKRWEDAVSRGFVFPAGGVCEQFYVSGKSDEGCSEADWLRLNLMLWRNTLNDRYIDSAERTLYNEYQMNQWRTGGFGHRYMVPDEDGCFAWGERYAESWWCCSYHGPLGYYEFKEFLAVGQESTDGKPRLLYNFPLDFQTSLEIGGEQWRVDSRQIQAKTGSAISSTLAINGSQGVKLPVALRKPEWATSIRVTKDDEEIATRTTDSRVCFDAVCGEEYEIDYLAAPYLEDRRFNRRELPKTGEVAKGCALRYGPNVLVAKENDASAIPNVSLRLDESGVIQLDPSILSCPMELSEDERDRKHAFVFNVTIVR